MRRVDATQAEEVGVRERVSEGEKEGGDEAMSRDFRVVIGYMCRGFAWLVGGVSVVGSFLELGYGQAHGPSIVAMSLLAAPFVIAAAVISRRLLR